MNITCAIIDDEPLARMLLKGYVERTPFLTLTGMYDSAMSAVSELSSNPPNLVFMDIQIPDMDGLKFSRLLPSQTKVVFTTAFSEYAAQAYRVNALDYLVKPINYAEFLESVNKAHAWLDRKQHIVPTPAPAEKQEEKSSNETVFIKSDYKVIQIALNDILLVEGYKDYLKFYLVNDTTITSLLNMKNVEDSLPRNRFKRVHRSYIVQMNKVDYINKGMIYIGSHSIPISDGYKEEVNQYVNTHLI